MFRAHSVLSKIFLSIISTWRYSSVFSFRSATIVLSFMYRLIHLKLTFVCGTRKRQTFIFPLCIYPVLLVPFTEKDFPLLVKLLWYFLWKLIDHTYLLNSMFGSFGLFFLSLHQYHTVFISMRFHFCSFIVSFEFKRVRPPALLFFRIGFVLQVFCILLFILE